MLTIFGILMLTVIIIFGPQIWVRYILKRYNNQIEQLPGTGGELALHLVDTLGLPDITVEISDAENNHYDPENKVVSLSPEVYNGKSFTAIAISAHEIGHAIQHFLKYKPLILRWYFSRYVASAEKIASILLIAFPFIVLVTHIPTAGILMLVLGLTFLALPVLFHLITLPVELDASFKRALPILIQGKYIPESAIPIVNKILFAAALTYLSASLVSILNFYRWVAILKR
jgi:Zn-dependent membrane protease YugP